jgi:hypothetical protein
MIGDPEEELLIKNRLSFRELSIKKLSSKYVELLQKLSEKNASETSKVEIKKECLNLVKDIIMELENIEISILKAENYEKLKEKDIKYHNTSSETITKDVKVISKEIEEFNTKFIQAKKDKDYKNSCEEIGKVINSYSSQTELNNQINQLDTENKKIKNSQNNIMKKISSQSKKLSLLLSLVNDLKNISNITNENVSYTNNINNNMIID